jgi:putative N-acetylmannosamine-6-phosphate epimerase
MKERKDIPEIRITIRVAIIGTMKHQYREKELILN